MLYEKELNHCTLSKGRCIAETKNQLVLGCSKLQNKAIFPAT